VFTAVDGEQGLDAFRAHRADLQLVITDVVMPKLSGFDMYEVIRGESRGLSVLFMSGFPAPNFRKTVGQDPAVAFRHQALDRERATGASAADDRRRSSVGRIREHPA